MKLHALFTTFLTTILTLSLTTHTAYSTEKDHTPSSETCQSKKKVLNGYDGGMMIHTGYLFGNIPQINHNVKGAPLGIGGVIRLHLGEHWRVGSEGYTSKLNQLKNGSYIKYGWGGVLADYGYEFNKVKLYAGLTLGGGGCTEYLMMNGHQNNWEPIKDAYFHKDTFFAVDPFVGCEFYVTDALHLTAKIDWLNAIGVKNSTIPTGPRLYFGFIFCH